MGAIDMPSGRRVLVIEGHVDLGESLCAVLEVWGHSPALARGGVRGVTHALRHEPDVIVVALGLPDLDGCKVVRLIRADPRGATPLIIAYSGYARREAEALEAGCDAFVLKPDIDRLHAVIEMGRADAAQLHGTTDGVTTRTRNA
jgi:two-component system CheB/CheR fusion protein